MRFNELTDEELSVLKEEFAALRAQVAVELRPMQRYIAAGFVGAGFCVFGCIRAIMLGPAMSAAAMLLVFALGLSYFFGTAWVKLMSHNIMVRASERTYLVLVFEQCAEDGIEFSTHEVAHFLKFAPDRPISESLPV